MLNMEIEFSVTPMPKLVYLWKLVSGFFWVILLILFNNINQDLSPLIAALAIILVSNFVMILVLLITAVLNKSFYAFMKNLMDVGNYSLLVLVTGGLCFLVTSSFISIKSSLVFASISTGIMFSYVVIYIITKLLNGNYMKIGIANMWSSIVQAILMYVSLFLFY